MNVVIHLHTLGWSCCTASTVEQTLTPDFVTAEGTLLQRMLDSPALPSAPTLQLPQASALLGPAPGLVSATTLPLPKRTKKNHPICVLNMLHQNDKKAGWLPRLADISATSTQAPFILLIPAAVAEERAAGGFGIFAPTGTSFTSCLVWDLCLFW